MGNFERIPEARQEAEERLKAGGPASATAPKSLPLREIKEDRALFYVRAPLEVAKRAHVADLRKPLADKRPLDPIVVWWGGDGWYCLDGHLRLEAYAKAKWSKAVPVAVFQGPLLAAIAEATSRNAKVKLNMTSPERNDAAWRMVCLARAGEVGKEHISACSGVCERQVGYMRKAKRVLLEKDPELDLFGMKWQEARKEAAGEEGEEGEPTDWDAEDERLGKEIADKLTREFGAQLRKHPTALAHCVEFLGHPFPSVVMESLAVYRPEAEEDEVRDF